MTEPKEWETLTVENRLTQRHKLALAGKAARGKKSAWIGELAEKLYKEVAQWRYRKRLEAPSIEVAWIIHSQIAWKGPWADTEDLFDDMAQTDPIRVLKAEAEGPESESPIPQETLLLLGNILREMKNFGKDIQKEEFSKNWAPGAKWATKGKSGVKKRQWRYKRKKIPGRKTMCSSTLLSDFFELKG